MTADDKYLLLIRNIRRRINDTVSASPTPGEEVVFDNDDLIDEINLAIKYIGREDILEVRVAQYELIILRVWIMITKILAFDSAKFFSITQTNQSINKGERTAHYLNVADNLEKLLDDAMKKIGDGTGIETGNDFVAGDIVVLDRDTLSEETAVADSPPVSIHIKSIEKLEAGFTNENGVTYAEGDYLVSWERSNVWDFNRYKFYIGDNDAITKDTGRALFSIINNNTTECIINFKDYTGTKYLVAYVLDNREQYSEPSEAFQIEFDTGSV